MCGRKAEIKMLFRKSESTLNCFSLHLSYSLSLFLTLVAKPGGEVKGRKIQAFMNIITYEYFNLNNVQQYLPNWETQRHKVRKKTTQHQWQQLMAN